MLLTGDRVSDGILIKGVTVSVERVDAAGVQEVRIMMNMNPKAKNLLIINQAFQQLTSSNKASSSSESETSTDPKLSLSCSRVRGPMIGLVTSG